MVNGPGKYRVFLSAAEPSADAHCAGLLTALKKSPRDIDFVGVGGPKMAQAGCELLETTVGRAAMIYNAFAHVLHFYKLTRRIARYLKDNNVDLVVVCDSPAFNIHIARAAKKAGVKTLFYVAPQLWAWGAWRIGKLRRYCDRLCCVLPFEQQWFESRRVDAVFVGNPMLDGLPSDLGLYKRKYADFDPADVHLAIMPGSRAAEIKTLWQPMQQIALRLKAKYPGATFTTVAVDSQRKELLESTQIHGFKCEYVLGNVAQAARQADFSIVASGSATLQVAAVGCPMVIMYQSSRILWHLVGRWILKTEHLSLINVLARRNLVPEFMPYFTSIVPIAETIENLLEDRDTLARINAELLELAQPLAVGTTSEKVARIAAEMLP